MKNNYHLLIRSISLFFLMLTTNQLSSFGQGVDSNTACNLALTTRVMQAEPWYGMWGPFNGAGSIDLTVTGGTAPYTYRWNAGVSSQDLSLASPGMYSVRVTDATGCTAMTTLHVGTKNNPLVLTSSPKNTSMAGGTDGAIDLSVMGGTGPYTYRWSNGVITEDLTGLMAGSYSVIVTDAMGKQATTTLMVSAPAMPLSLYIAHQHVRQAGGYGFIDLTVVGGVGPYTYRWNAGSRNEDLPQVTPGMYTVMVTDATGAMATASVQVIGFGMTAIVTITDCNRNAWVDQQNPNTVATFNTAAPNPPLGNGSLEYKTLTGALGNFRNLSYHNTLLASLTTFSYASYIQSRTNNTDNLYVVLQIDRTGDGLEDDRLIFEPRWQTGTWVAGILPDQGPTLERTWQTWNLLQAIWWFGPPKTLNPETGGEYFTLASYIRKYPNAKIVNQPIGGGFGGIRLNVGSPRVAPFTEYWGAAFTGYVDAFTIGVNGQNTIYNFEQCSTNAIAQTKNRDKHAKTDLLQLATPEQLKVLNYPNPFTTVTTIQYDLPFDGAVSLKVYDLAGRAVSTLVSENKKAGRHAVDFNKNNLSAGVYLYKITATAGVKNLTQTNRMLIE